MTPIDYSVFTEKLVREIKCFTNLLNVYISVLGKSVSFTYRVQAKKKPKILRMKGFHLEFKCLRLFNSSLESNV